MEIPSPERWQRIEELVDAALDVPVAERESWLRTACGEDVAMFREVTRLLEAGERPDGFLVEPVANLASSLRAAVHAVAEARDDAIPQRVGSYRIVRKLGRGGMGTVYLAEREAHFEQRVALKVVRREFHRDEHLVRRFVDERQMLASLEHANIARLLDGGVTEEGSPWFAMEYVEGDAIDRWCDDTDGSPSRRDSSCF
jgi:serine/threonine-protein kinase